MSNLKNSEHIGEKLWDEILKAIVTTMPEQIFPLIKEVYHIEYPSGTPVTLISTEYSTYEENENAPLSSKLMDIALLINGTDYYHLECQMKNNSEMIIRMLSYDLHFAIQHGKHKSHGEIVIHFPNSVVLYPDYNKNLPDTLSCRLIFQDKSEHIYQIPTVRIQSYSLEEIRQKHLTLFLPYILLRFRPLLKQKKYSQNHILENELTNYTEAIIVVLEEEYAAGNLNDIQYNDYIKLINHAAKRIFHKHPQYYKEVAGMTEPKLILPSMILKKQVEEAVEEAKVQIRKELEIQMKEKFEMQAREELEVQVKEQLETQIKTQLLSNARNMLQKNISYDIVKLSFENQLTEEELSSVYEEFLHTAQNKSI